MRITATLLLFGALLAPPAALADPAAEARAVMEETVAAVLAVLSDDARDKDAKREALETIALERFDFPTMAKLVLKRDWRKLDPAQRRAFIPAFRNYLASTYGDRISDYRQEGVELTGERKEARGDVTVLTRIMGSGATDGAQLDYRLRQRDGKWRIIDVVIENISLVSNLRSQFSDVLQRGGPDELLRLLKKKNAESKNNPDKTERAE